MITAIKNFNTFTADGEPVTVIKYAGLSTDVKPTDCANGSTFVEIDTSDEYMFDAAGTEWVKKNSSVGGGLPSPTASDKGKALVVTGTPTEGAVIVPEQTVQAEANTPVAVSDADASAFVVGDEVIATIDGVTYSGVLEDQGGMVGAGFDNGVYYFFNSGGTVMFGADHSGEFTVKLNAKGADRLGYGFGGGALKVTASSQMLIDGETGQPYFDAATLDVSYADVVSAVQSGRYVYLVGEIEGGAATLIMPASGFYHYEDADYVVSFTMLMSDTVMTLEFMSMDEDGPLMY